MNNVEQNQNDSGTGPGAILPSELKGLNWGAFFLGWIWGIAHNTWLSFLWFVPGFKLIMPFVLLFKGNEWAWQNRKFSSPEEFKEIQRKWTLWGLVALVFYIILFIYLIYAAVLITRAGQNMGHN